ncbi:hypothetical protein L208DRAFT_1382694 [Tricholoma matsutake]|nr:hypothetical protein L208DRAFT_1382694 [Tricholoma matsutake 945]
MAAVANPYQPPPQPRDAVITPPQPPALPPTRDDQILQLSPRKNAYVKCNEDDRLSAAVYATALLTRQQMLLFLKVEHQHGSNWHFKLLSSLSTIPFTNSLQSLPWNVVNQNRGDRRVVPYAAIKFPDGLDPTQPPHNLPALRHRLAIERLNAQELVQYITGYGIVLPIATNAAATDLARKEVLKDIIGCIVY